MQNELKECAKAIRAELKQKYPGVKFSVRSERFSMGNAVDVRYPKEAGINHQELNKSLEKYAYGTFDGITDCQGIKASNGLPRAKFVSAYPVSNI